MTRATTKEPLAREIAWHDLENGAYSADLGWWVELADTAASPGARARVVDLGCGTGRVALTLAALGHDVTGVDRDSQFLDELHRRAAAHGLQVATAAADARTFDLRASFDLVLAPMQFIQLLASSGERRALLTRARGHLRPGGMFACAILDLEGEPVDDGFDRPLPDVCERDGWVYSSHAVALRVLDRGRAISLDRVRQAVSPRGEVEDELSQIRLELVSPEALEHEASAEGLEPAGRHTITATEMHVGSIGITARRTDG